MDDDFVKKRLERDLADLKRMCDDHFKKRKDDDAVVTDLEKRIADRQTVSAGGQSSFCVTCKVSLYKT